MKNILIAGFAAALSMGFAACNNGAYDANPSTNNSGTSNPLNNGSGGSNNSALLTSGKWKISEMTLTTSSGTTDMLALVQDCEKDDIFTFNTDNTATRDEGATKCSPGDAQTRSEGTWSINGAKFSATNGANSFTWDIITLDNSTFKISSTINGSTSSQTYVRP
ncbi:MAG TPA: lipocalin family protein [Flavipsychrobacter sp.]|nr:lipocalin family protein [Flavipsychrobacter sp.]